MSVTMTRKSSIPADCTVVAGKDHISCNLEEGLVILSVTTGEYYGLNAVGNSIWNLIQEPRTIPQLCDALLAEYDDVAPEQCSAEVFEMLEKMVELRLIEVRSQSTK